MADVAANGARAPTVRQQGGRSCARSGRSPARAAPKPFAQLYGARQLTRAELYARIANDPARAGMRRPRRDYLENVGRVYDAYWRHARATRNAHVCTSWSQLAIACGYPPEAKVLRSLQRYAAVLARLGLVRAFGTRDQAGAWCRLELLGFEPPTAPPAAGVACEARRRRETRAQRHQRRERPWRRQGGQGRAVERWDVTWSRSSSFLRSPLSPPPPLRPYGAEEGAGELRERETRACADAEIDVGATIEAPGSTQKRETRPSAPPGSHRWAALSRCRTAARGDGGLTALAGLAGEVDPCSLLAAAFELRFPSHPDRRTAGAGLSARWAGRLERAVDRLDRLEGEGTGARRLLELVAEHEVAGDRAFVGVLKRIGGHRQSAVVWSQGEPIFGSGSANRGHHGPLPATAALFAQRLHRESKVAAIRARGGRTYDELRPHDKREAAAELARQVHSGEPAVADREMRRRAKLVLRARRGDPEARAELSRLILAERARAAAERDDDC